MKKAILLCLVFIMMSISNCFSQTTMTKEERAQAAQEIASMLESKQWVFYPSDVTHHHGSRVDQLQSEENKFLLQGDTLVMNLNISRGTVHSPLAPDVRTYLGFMHEKVFLYKNDIVVSADNKSVTAKLEGTFEGLGSEKIERVLIDVNVNIENGITRLHVRNSKRDAIYSGSIGEYLTIDLNSLE